MKYNKSKQAVWLTWSYFTLRLVSSTQLDSTQFGLDRTGPDWTVRSADQSVGRLTIVVFLPEEKSREEGKRREGKRMKENFFWLTKWTRIKKLGRAAPRRLNINLFKLSIYELVFVSFFSIFFFFYFVVFLRK